MTRIRVLAVALLVCGLVLGTVTDRVPSRESVRVDGFEVLIGDFHIHAFIGDGAIAPWMLQRHAARLGLDVIAITNHNQTLTGRLGRAAARRSSGPLVLVGEEITGRDFHLIAVGIERRVEWDQPVRLAIEQVHAQGGVAIAAHPLHGFAEGYDEVALAELDGLEAAHPDRLTPRLRPQFEEFFQRTLVHNPQVAAIGSSDFHTNAPMGLCRTYLLVRERSAAAVLDAIRDGRSVGRCDDGPLRGRPEIVRLLEPYRDALATPRAPGLARLALACVWLSLVALALAGTRG
jgi:hypothetical protein